MALIAAGASSWIIVEFIDGAEYWSPALKFAMRVATVVLIAPEMDKIADLAAELATSGERVVAIELPPGAPPPTIGGA